jgi:hypothetical protein
MYIDHNTVEFLLGHPDHPQPDYITTQAQNTNCPSRNSGYMRSLLIAVSLSHNRTAGFSAQMHRKPVCRDNQAIIKFQQNSIIKKDPETSGPLSLTSVLTFDCSFFPDPLHGRKPVSAPKPVPRSGTWSRIDSLFPGPSTAAA